MRQWLLPWIERQHVFNARTADAIDALINRDRERAAALGGFQSALIVFLQRNGNTGRLNELMFGPMD